MGSFNYHCKTGAVIQKGDEAVFIPVGPNGGYRGYGHNYPTHLYGPLMYEPLRGIYNEYGDLDPCFTPEVKAKLETFFTDASIRKVTHEIQSLTLDPKVVNLHQTPDHDRRCYMLTFRAEMYDYILASQADYGEKLRGLKDSLREHLDETVRTFDEFWADKPWDKSGVELDYAGRCALSGQRPTRCPLVYAFSPWGSNDMWVQSVTLKDLTNAIDRAHHDGDEKTFDELVEKLITFTQFKEGLEWLGFDWTPGPSSPVIQGDEMEYFEGRKAFHLAQLELVKNDIAAKQKEYDEW